MLIVIALLLPGLLSGPYMDAGVFSQLGEVLRRGGVPYIDAWDHKPPGIFVIDALSQAAMPFASPWTAAWLATVAATAAVLVLLATLLRADDAGRRIRLTLCAAAACLTVYPVAVGGGLAEVPGLAFATAAVVPVMRVRAGVGRLILAGALAGCACVIIPQAASASLATLYLAVQGRETGGGIRALGAFVFGVAIAGGSTLVWLWRSGALQSAFDAIVTYNGVYVQINRQNIGYSTLSQTALAVGCLACLIFPAALAVLQRGPRGAPRRSRVTTAAWIWLVAFAVVTAAQVRIAPHYFLMAVPPLAVLGAPVFDRATREVGPMRRRHALQVVLGGIVVSAVVASVVTQRYLTRSPTASQIDAVGAWLRGNVAQDASVFAWGNQPYIYDAADRRPASKYVHMLPLTTPGYSTTGQIADLVAHLESNPPQAIIDAGSSAPGEPGWLPLLIPRTVAIIDGRELDLLDPIRSFVRENYHLAATVVGWPVYLRN